jgi:5-methyltetrahydrofolate--homocysteine methyltransferase
MNARNIQMPVICGGAALTRKYVEEDLAGLYKGEVYYGQDAFSGLRIMDELKKPDRASKITKTGATRGKKMEAIIQEKQPPVFVKSNIPHDNVIPQTPFLGYRVLKNIRMEEVFGWVNPVALFRAQWQFRRGNLSNEEFERGLKEKAEPIFEELKKKCLREKILRPLVIYGYYPCYSENNDLVVLEENKSTELVRFTFPRQKEAPFLCLSDFFYPKESGKIDVMGCQIVTVGQHASEVTKKLFEENKYTDYLYLHGLSVESAEALAEYAHAMIRREMGFENEDNRDVRKLLAQGYRGSRYSFGYPACPHLEDQTKLFKLLPADKIGVKLSEEFQLEPEQSTSAIVVHHPRAKYFNI